MPLKVRDRPLGALTLVSAESGRHYGPDDVALAEDLARRAATAIDNARLYGEVAEQRERYAVTLASIGDAVIATDARGHVTFLNQVAAELTGWDLDAAVGALCELPGIGDWTAQVIALRALGEPDAFPAADLGLLQAMDLSPRALRERAESWRPWRGYAAAAIWLC